MAMFWQKGEKIDYMNSGSSAIEAGTVIMLGTHPAIAVMEIPAEEKGTVVTEGVFKIEKTASETYAAGDELYWDETNSAVTKTAGTNPAKPAIGWAIEAAAASDTYAVVKIG